MKAFGYRLPACSAESFPRRVRDQVPPELQPILLPLLVQVVQLTRTIRVYDRLLEQVARRYYPETERLGQVTGVGVLTALAYVVTLEDPARFAKSRQVGPYLGLSLRRDQSGERDPQLGITKAGNSYELLVECGWKQRKGGPRIFLSGRQLFTALCSCPSGRGVF